MSRKDVRSHLICQGFLKGYTQWVFHGEFTIPTEFTNQSRVEENPIVVHDMHRLLQDSFRMLGQDGDSVMGEPIEEPTIGKEFTNQEAQNFYKLLAEADQQLYPDAKSIPHFLLLSICSI